MFDVALKRIFLLYVALCYAFFVLSYLVTPEGKARIIRSDFTAYYTAAKIIRTEKTQGIYDLSLQHQVQKEAVGNPKDWKGTLAYRNPPVIAWALSPISYLSLENAYRVYFLINIVLICFGFYILAKIVNPNVKVWFALVFYLPTFSLIYYAQASTYIFLILTLIYFCLKKNRNYLVGILASLLFLKLQYLILIPFVFILVKRKWQFIKSFILSLFLIVGVNILIYGPKLLTDYLNYLLITENGTSAGTNIVHNLNLVGLLNELDVGIGPLSPIIIALGISILLYIGIWLWLYKKRNHIPDELAFTVMLVSSMFLNIHTMPVDLSLLILSLVLVWSLIKSNNMPILKYLLVMLYLMPFSTVVELPWLSTLLLGAILGVSLVALI